MIRIVMIDNVAERVTGDPGRGHLDAIRHELRELDVGSYRLLVGIQV